MKTVWAVEQGQYSDYHVVGVFSTKEAAELCASEVNRFNSDPDEDWNRASIDEWTLDPHLEELRAGFHYFRLWMLRDGTVNDISDREWLDDPDFGFNAKRIESTGRIFPSTLRADVWARDKEHAIKIANERRVQMIAANEWPEDL